jgi:hydrogenase nickel incorporation protein HypA/HybF
MHEMGIASEILATVRKEALRLNGQRPIKVGVRIGQLAAVDPEALQFCFQALVQETDLEPLELDIELRPRKHRCPQCEEVFAVIDYAIQCPRCGNLHTEFKSGDELELAYLELSDHEPLAAHTGIEQPQVCNSSTDSC